MGDLAASSAARRPIVLNQNRSELAIRQSMSTSSRSRSAAAAFSRSPSMNGMRAQWLGSVTREHSAFLVGHRVEDEIGELGGVLGNFLVIDRAGRGENGADF